MAGLKIYCLMTHVNRIAPNHTPTVTLPPTKVDTTSPITKTSEVNPGTKEDKPVATHTNNINKRHKRKLGECSRKNKSSQKGAKLTMIYTSGSQLVQGFLQEGPSHTYIRGGGKRDKFPGEVSYGCWMRITSKI